MTKVSFIVPTLNRGHYVVRAVASCLRAGEAVEGVEIEVVVLDSQSDDGSWELLQTAFTNDPRVKLVQNQRGLGPTHSWIDGVDCANGDYMTFVWSDDLVSPRFLSRLLPLMNERTHLAIGGAVSRGIDEEAEFPEDDRTTIVSSMDYVAGFFEPYAGRTPDLLTPVCALFTREAFDTWKDVARSWGRATQLREQVMWRRAIGPDLMLYFVGALSGQQVAFTSEPVAQLSAHDGSISVASSKYLLRAGYWLARCWLVTQADLTRDDPNGRPLMMAAETFFLGRLLAARFPDGALKGMEAHEIRRMIEDERAIVWNKMRRDHSIFANARAMVRTLLLRVIPRRHRGLRNKS